MSGRYRTTSRIRLFYKEGCGELWVEKRIRQYFPFLAMFTHTPRERRLDLFVAFGDRNRAVLALHREAWVQRVGLADSRWRFLPPLRQPFPPNLPEQFEDMEKPFPGHRR